jgi:nitrogen regulatory protein PII
MSGFCLAGFLCKKAPYLALGIKTLSFDDYGMVNNPIFALLMKKALFSTILMLICMLASAQNYKQHPLFIYSFTRYIQWPDAYNQGDFEILVMGDSPILEELKALAQHKKVGDRTITVSKINNVTEIRRCNMLFIPADKSDKLNEVLQKVDKQSVLVITEQAGLGVRGSCINFITKEGKLAFELNQSAFAKRNLKASNEITRLATMI